MKLSDFEVTGITIDHGILRNWIAHAEVTVESGVLWWKKYRRVKIYRDRFSSFWRYAESGDHTPGSQAEKLESAYLAAHRTTSIDKLSHLSEGGAP